MSLSPTEFKEMLKNLIWSGELEFRVVEHEQFDGVFCLNVEIDNEVIDSQEFIVK